MSLDFVFPVCRLHSPVQEPLPQLTATRSAPLFTDRVVFEPAKFMSCLTSSGQSSIYRSERSQYVQKSGRLCQEFRGCQGSSVNR